MSDTESLAKVFLELRAGLARAISGLVPPKEIEDIVQETYVRVRQTANLHRIRQPKSFLYKTAKNLALDHLKRAETKLLVLEADLDRADHCHNGDRVDQTYRSATSDEEFARFCDAVRYLPIQCRRAFVLRKVYGFSQKEIAETMKIAESTVEKHIAEGVRRTFLHLKHAVSARDDATSASVTSISAPTRRNLANE